MQNLFVYGTLLSSGIIKKLTGKTFSSKKAILHNFKRYCVKACDYPTITPRIGEKTIGLILKDVSDSSLKIIDFFEGEEYERKQVKGLLMTKKLPLLTIFGKRDQIYWMITNGI
ncbi:MAG: gamma-glutamylcyclotransferase [Bacteroidetes bacterium]|nr:gamma-glutamylcyclotransferase [Bacteroidota bacterium]